MKYLGKEKCRILKQIRAEIAKQNGIEWLVEECTHKGDCKGTCPRCEAEVRQLERELEKRAALGKKVAIVGIAAGLSLSVAGCANPSSMTQTNGMMAEPTPAVTQEILDGEEVPEVCTEIAGELLPETYEEIQGGLPLPIPGEVPDETEEEVTWEELMGDMPLPSDKVEIGGEPVDGWLEEET